MNALDRRVLAASAAFAVAGLVGFVGAAATGSRDGDAAPVTTTSSDEALPTDASTRVEPAVVTTVPDTTTTSTSTTTSTTSTTTTTTTTTSTTTTTEPDEDVGGFDPDPFDPDPVDLDPVDPDDGEHDGFDPDEGDDGDEGDEGDDVDRDEFDAEEFLNGLEPCLTQPEVRLVVDDETIELLASWPIELCLVESTFDDEPLGVSGLDPSRFLDEGLCLLLTTLGDDVRFVSPPPCSDDSDGSPADAGSSSEGELDLIMGGER